MRKLVSAAFGTAAVIALCVGFVAMGPRASLGDTKECSWGEIKCCYAQPPCSDCCVKPKDDGVELYSVWLPAFLRDTLWSAFRVLVA